MKNNIKKLRIERNITQTQLTMMTGIPTATISGLETGKRDIANHEFKTILTLAKALNVNIEDLVGE